jgi:aryl-alcohol dehydrogenase-like predicted oxidoreductase
MKYVRLGSTGLEVSRIAVGCMGFGDPARGDDPWTIGEDDTGVMVKLALEAGVNFFDTANVYSAGSSEELLGRALGEYASRGDVIIATKVCNRMRPGPNGAGLSRQVIFREIDDSLRRLRTDYIDLYQIHRWDPVTPIEETLEALHDLVRSGKVRYLGASSMHSWQFCQALYTARLHSWTSFATMQDHYNLLNREEEREMIPLCVDQGIGILPWSPLARGRLARPWDEVTERQRGDENVRLFYPDSDRVIADRVGEIAAECGCPRSQVALAWLLGKKAVTAPVIGMTRPLHLNDALAALDLQLHDDQVCRLESPYQPRSEVGFS